MVESTPVVDPGTLFSVQGTVALITGGGTGKAETPVRVVKKILLTISTGIGFMIAKALDANGAEKVYIVGRRREILEAAAREAVSTTLSD